MVQSSGSLLPFSGQKRAFCGSEAGTDARKVADSQQVVLKGCPGRRTLDQESPGSSPGGATRRSDTTSVGRAFSFLRPLLAFLLAVHRRLDPYPLRSSRHLRMMVVI